MIQATAPTARSTPITSANPVSRGVASVAGVDAGANAGAFEAAAEHEGRDRVPVAVVAVAVGW